MAKSISSRKFQYQFPSSGRVDMATVEAIRSSTDGLILTPVKSYREPLYSITHAQSGLALFSASGYPLKRARYLAGALGGFDVDWLMVTPDTAHKVPSNVRDWIRENWR